MSNRLERLQESAQQLSAATGNQCLAAQADVRNPKQLQDAVAKTIEKFGKIDFVICGMGRVHRARSAKRLMCSCARAYAGAAGNFLAPISKLSENGFKTVIEIDTVCSACVPEHRRSYSLTLVV